MELGQLGALDYRINFPEQAVARNSPTTPQQDFELPEIDNDPIAHRGKLTADYYNNVGLLRSFLQEHGSEAAKPDYSQEGGGLAFQTFQKLQAGVMLAANALEGELEAEQKTRPFELTGQARLKPGVEREGLYYSDPDNFMSTKLPQGVEETNQRLAQETNTPQDQARANQLLDLQVQRIDQQVQQGLISPEEGEYYKQQLVPNRFRNRVFAPRSEDGGGQYGYQIALLRKYTNLKNGVWSPETFSTTVVGGKTYLKNEESKGDTLGKYSAGVDKNGNPVLKDKIVDSWLKDPQTGKVFVKYTDPNIPMEEVSNQPGDAITRSFVSNNSKYGSVDKIMEAATASGLTNELGASVDELLMPQNYQQIQKAVADTAAKPSERVDAVVKSLRNQLQTLEDPFMGNNWVAYDLPDGRKVQIAKHRGQKSYYVKNWQELGYSQEPKNLSEDNIFNILGDFGYLNQFLEERPQSTTSNSIDPDI